MPYTIMLSSSVRSVQSMVGGMLVHVGIQVGGRDGDKALDNWRGPATHSIGMYRTIVDFLLADGHSRQVAR
jgi:hypothetical protein